MQLDLLTDSSAPRFPRARRNDASSSHEAAAAMERTGAAWTQALAVLAALKLTPGCTSHELAERMHVERVMPARRLPELAALNLVRKAAIADHTVPCHVTGKRALRWYPL